MHLIRKYFLLLMEVRGTIIFQKHSIFILICLLNVYLNFDFSNIMLHLLPNLPNNQI